MKWFRRIFITLFILFCVLFGTVFLTALDSDKPIGFQSIQAKARDGKAFVIGVWYPTQSRTWPMVLGPLLIEVAQDAPVSGSSLPLVVISHGNGGGIGSHADLALALANAGYVVAALMHTGDNFADQSAAGSASLYRDRGRQLQAAIDYMLMDWKDHHHINPDRIGAFGFSAGGFTVLTAVGAQPNLRLIAKTCADSPEFVCEVLRHAKSPLLNANSNSVGDDFLPDPRIKAAVVAAPGLGFTMGPHALDNVRVPIQLWSGDLDDKVPYTTNTRFIRDSLGSRVEFHAVPGAGHLSFLAPCGILRPPGLCEDVKPFDREAFHADMNARVVAFFEKNIKMP
jgi:predicted dienelactone hydrolase